MLTKHFLFSSCTLVVLGQMNPMDQIPGGGMAGWASFLMSGGVLIWLLFWHLPSKDKQLEKFQDGKDVLMREMAEKYEKKLEKVSSDSRAAIEKVSTEFKSSLETVLKHCDEETKSLVVAFQAEMGRILSESRGRSTQK